MPKSLMAQKIEEALIATGHSRHDAQKLLIAWAVRDPALLLEMTKPQLKAIAAGHIDHFLRQKDGKKKSEAEDERLSKRAIDEIVFATSSDRRHKKAVPPPKSTERQASTMRRLAEAFSRKKK
ncbi:MAG: hypothetical protein PHS57_08995 [Alphaproteobacteria bacterium]|nr:hypothetical protein [Alphaproteobacteria bacterium]